MTALRVTEAAARSIVEQADCYLEVADSSLALRWEEAVDEAIHSMLKWPARGAPCHFHAPALAGLRWKFVPGFPKHLVFYRYSSEEEALLIVQMLHGARDLEAILTQEE